jgi:Branched-chain amino acid transport system / permease component
LPKASASREQIAGSPSRSFCLEIFGVPTKALAGQIVLGLVNGSFYAILSLELAVIFGMLNIVNFAHGALFMMGSIAARLSLAKFSDGDGNYCNSRSSACPERARFSSTVPSLSGSAALNRSSTTFRYSSFDSVPSLSRSAEAISAASTGLLTRVDREFRRGHGRVYRTAWKLLFWLPQDLRFRRYAGQSRRIALIAAKKLRIVMRLVTM